MDSSSLMTGSSCSSGSPASTCTFGATSTDLTRPGKSAVTAVSIFMLSSTTSGSPTATRSPGDTATDTITAGAGERTTPPSSRAMVWVTPSTSTVWTGPTRADSTRCRRPGRVTRRSTSPSRSTSTSTSDVPVATR